MDCELVRLAGVPVGLVTSALFYTTDTTSLNQPELEGPSEQAKEVQIAICPTGRLIAFIASFKAQFVARSEALYVGGGGVTSSSAAYQTSYEGLLKVVRDPNTPRPIATAVIVVPVTLETRKDPSSIILVGFSDGYIRAYSKMGVGLFSQQFHGEPVITIHCMAPSGDHGGPKKQNMSVLVVFSSVVCMLEGWSLCEVVNHAVTTRDSWAGEHEEAPLVSHQKWRLGDQRNTLDAALLGPSVPTLYDYLCEAGNVGGYDTVVKGSPTPQSRLIIVGESPMIALYKISKDSGTVNVSEVVSAVASKMTRSVLGKLSQAGGWLGWGGSGGGTPPSKIKPPEKKMVMNLPMSTNIPDERRTVTSISVSPLGDLSVCVDGFGRILLLDNHSATIRRMWKGYRDAQTGWLLVHDTPPHSSSAASSTSHKRRRKGTSSSDGGDSSPSSSAETQRRAQCLCVYLPRRGLVELWPVQNGSRIAVFQVGKGCRLLTAPHDVLTTSRQGEDHAGTSDRGGRGKGCGLQHTAVLLCPNGQLFSFLVPFPTLVRLNDSSSHDAHLLQKLSPALQAGDADGVFRIITTLKTAQALKEVVERVMYAHPVTNFTRQFPYTVLSSAVSRTNKTDENHGILRGYLVAVRQLLCLHSGLSRLSAVRRPVPAPPPSPSPPDKLAQMLRELCGLGERVAGEVAESLLHYAVCRPAKLHTHVLQRLSLKELMRCFELAAKMGSAELLSQEEGDVQSDNGADTRNECPRKQELESVPLVLKKSTSESSKFDLGFAIFHVLLTQDVPEKDVQALVADSGIPSSILLTLLCRVFLSGRVLMGSDPFHMLQRLYNIIHTITLPDVVEGESETLAAVRMQCSHTHNVGHALLITLLCHQLVATSDKDSDEHPTEVEEWGEGDWGGGGEGWDTVTEEGEQWVRLQHRLEVLTSLCGVVGLSVMSQTPPLPYLRQPPGDRVTVQLMNKESHGGCVSMVLLEAVGPWLTAHCIACWLVGQAVPPQHIATTPSDPASTQDTDCGKTVSQLGPLLKLFQHSLSSCSLLVHCAWQAAYLWKYEPTKHQELHQYALLCLSLIPNPRFLIGTCLFLWHYLFEPSLGDILDNLKRGGSQARPVGSLELVSLSRVLFTYLYQLRERPETGEDEGMDEGMERQKDVILIPRPSDKYFLMDIAPVLAMPPSSLVQTYLALLLHTELALLLGTTHHVTSYYPTWTRMAVKRELLMVSRDGRHEHGHVATQLQTKRTKFLCESVTRYLDSPSPKLRPFIPSTAVRTQPSLATRSLSLEVTEVTGGLFLLGELWGVNVDTVRRHYVASLFAAGLGDRGKEAFQSVSNKVAAALDLLSLAGCLSDTLVQQIASKPERLAITAQVPPTQLEWIRKQNLLGITSSCPRLSPTWSSLSQLLSVIQPHLLPPPSPSSSPSTPSAISIAHSLAKIVSLQT